MSRYKHSSRLLRLFRIIREMRTRKRQTPLELYTRLGISKSQFQRDCQVLRNHGFIFHYNRKTKIYEIDEDATLPKSDLTLDEVFALVLALQQMAGISSTYIAAQAEHGVSKLLGSLSRKGVPDWSRHLRVAGAMQGSEAENRVIPHLTGAIAGRKRIRITYAKPGQSSQTVEIEPYHLYLCDGFIYLDAWCVPKKAMRRYKACRIKKIQVTGMGFSHFHGYDFQTRQKTAFKVFTGERTERVCICFSPDIRPLIQEYTLHETQKTNVLADGSLLVELEVAEPREVMWWTLRWGAQAEILEPKWLRHEVRDIVERMKKVYAKGKNKKSFSSDPTGRD
jgi:predicted DNA-binding transcriptional regulator YafY